MAGAVSYQLINNTGSQLNLVGTVQFPSDWLPAAPATISAGAESSISNNRPDGRSGATIVFGYAIEGSGLDQFWVVSNMDGTEPQVGELAPSGHSIQVNIEGNSEDGFSVTLTYQ
jgi:hypothetical protein